MNKVKIGVIGGGGIAGAHVPYLMTLGDQVEVVGVADVNPEAAAASATRYGLSRHTTSYRELLPDVDAVLVCVPTSYHADIVVDCLDSGKHVFTEKPMARTLEQADAMLAAQARSGCGLQVGFVRRFDAEWLAFRDVLQAGRIGKPVIWRDVAAVTGPGNPWFNVDEIGGGPFLDGCIHNIDFALSTFGPAKWAFCHGRTMRASSTAIDSGTATVRFESGDELMLAWSWGLPEGVNLEHGFYFIGPEGAITFPGAAGDNQRHFVINNGPARQESVTYAANTIAGAFERQMDEFLEVVGGGKVPRAGGAEGRASLEVGLAILKSARTEQVVNIEN